MNLQRVTTTLEVGTKISKTMSLDLLQHQKMLYSFFKERSLRSICSFEYGSSPGDYEYE